MSRNKKIISYGAVALWMLVIFLLSNQVADTSSAQSDIIVGAIKTFQPSLSTELLTFLTRKAAHIVAYLILGVLLYNLVRSYSLTSCQMIAISILLAGSYAVSDEIHQTFVEGRSGEVRDVLIDTSASAVGVMLYANYSDKRRK